MHHVAYCFLPWPWFQVICHCVVMPGGILRGSRRERLLSKFVENECEKIDRLMELYMRWLSLKTQNTHKKKLKRVKGQRGVLKKEKPIIRGFLKIWHFLSKYQHLIASYCIVSRYSDRVKAEAERIDQLELEDFEVKFSLNFCSLMILRAWFLVAWSIHLGCICRWMKTKSTTGS